jgi:uncharacterized membrane protein
MATATRGRRTMTGTVQMLVAVTTGGCGLVAGVWFAFSSFVMQGLHRADAREAVAAMHGINKTAVTAVFMTAFGATALLCLGLAVWGVLTWHDLRAKLVVAASAIYLIGSFGVTSAANVPLNNKLERVDASGPHAGRGWHDFYAPWLAWNHVRTITAIAAFALFLTALLRD